MKTFLAIIVGVLTGAGLVAALSPTIYALTDIVGTASWPLIRIWPLGALLLLAVPWPLALLVRGFVLRTAASPTGTFHVWGLVIPLGVVLGFTFVAVPAITAVPAPPVPSSTHVRVLETGHTKWPFEAHFANGSSSLTAIERRRLGDVGRALVECGVVRASVRGFASSAEFSDRNEERNVRLARKRAEAMADVLRRTRLEIDVVVWNQFEEMARERGFVDVDPQGKRLQRVEFVNRRAEARPDGDLPCAAQ
jgi:hypothetical protein